MTYFSYLVEVSSAFGCAISGLNLYFWKAAGGLCSISPLGGLISSCDGVSVGVAIAGATSSGV